NLQPWVVSGTADLGRRRRRTREKKTIDNKQNAGDRDPRSDQSPAAPSPIAGLERPNVRSPGSGPASMRKFGEYAFLKDSRYARQAKSSNASCQSARRAG